MTLYWFASIHLFVVGVATITLIASRPHLQRWGFVLGLYNQWAWMYVAIHDQSWGIAAVNPIYVLSYIRGIRNYWSYTWKPSTISPSTPADSGVSTST